MAGQTRHVVIEGEVIGGWAEAPQPPPPPPRKRRKRWPWIAGGIAAVVALCLAVPVAVFAAWVLRGAVEAGKGASTPGEAFVVYQMSFNHGGREGEMMAARTATDKKAPAILSARAEFLADRERDIARHPEWVWGEVKAGSAPAGQESYDVDWQGDHADMTIWFSVVGHANRDDWSDGWATSSLPWHAEAIRERDGWRLTEVEIPKWCGAERTDGTYTGYSKC